MFLISKQSCKIPPQYKKKLLEKKDLELIFYLKKKFCSFFSKKKGIGDKTKKAKKHQKGKKFFPLLDEN